MRSTSLDKTAAYWDARRSGEHPVATQWWDLSAVVRYRNTLLSGDPEVGFEEYTARRYLGHGPAGARVLSLGCGQGELERKLFRLGVVGTALGLDIGEGGLARARQSMEEEGLIGLEYRLADLNEVELEARSYDAVYAAGILHHLSDLEHVYRQVARSLEPDGWFFLDEYVGPNRFQFSSQRRRLIEAAFALIPPSLRCLPARSSEGRGGSRGARAIPAGALSPRLLLAKLRSGRLIDALRYRFSLLGARPAGQGEGPILQRPRFPTAEDVAHGDPSEAVRSEEILDLLQRDFEIVEQKGTGLGLLQFLLADIAANFLDPSEESARILDMLIEIERSLSSAGYLAHDFVFVAAHPRTSP